jgi:hypothetical protein
LAVDGSRPRNTCASGASAAAPSSRRNAGSPPIALEHRRGGAGGGADHHQVEVAEIEFIGRVEVLVAQVAAAADEEAVVGDPGLVVHPAVEVPAAEQQFERKAEPAEDAPAGAVEQPHFDMRMGIERRQHPFPAEREYVIKQQPHPHAAVRRP